MENDAPVVGQDAPTADSKRLNLDCARGLELANFRLARKSSTKLAVKKSVW